MVQLTLSNSTSSTSVNQLPGGTYNVQAHYEGDGTFVPSDSPMTKVTISPEPSTATATTLTGTPPNLTSFSAQVYGNPLYLQATVTGKSGVGTPTGTINFSDSIKGPLGSVTLDDTGTATTQNLVQLVRRRFARRDRELFRRRQLQKRQFGSREFHADNCSD